MILIGFMGSGKTTIASGLGERMNMQAIDLDEEVVKLAGKEIPRIFEEEGEAGFRQKEFEALARTSSIKGIVATGGGVVTYDRSYDFLKITEQPVIYLHADFETLYNRIEGDENRPLVKRKDQVRALYDRRLVLYRQVADHEIDASLPVEEVISGILKIKWC
ncbi:shikimate kinase [Salinicoccus bachuensis]|uniref:Shikimate kinase n=1 Tax=Salinicoccus bachuensis TaxID=3136731 RepID=A0ABZ3CEQ5_9STAP